MRLNFDVTLDPAIFSEFSINLSYTDFMIVRLNGNVVFSGPYGGNNLYSAGEKKEWLRTVNRGFLGTTRVHYYGVFPQVHNGNGYYSVGHNTNKNNHAGSIDLKAHIRQGHNEISIKGISVTSGNISGSMRSYERLCLKWSEPKWNESWEIRP